MTEHPAFEPTLPPAPPASAWPARPAPSAPLQLQLRFIGSGSEFFRIWAVNLLLTVVTFGLYYPFAKARRLKYFHGATELGGHPFAFHADPWKMFRGYLLVALMLAAYSGAGHFSPLAGLVAFAIVAALWPLLWHSSLRFRLANTSWRGLRFHFRGTRGGAYKVFAAPLLASALLLGVVALSGMGSQGEAGDTVGRAAAVLVLVAVVAFFLAAPAFMWLLLRHRQAHLALGPEHARFGLRLRSYLLLCLKVGGVSLLPVLLFGAVFAGLQAGGGAASPPGAGAMLLLPLVVLLFYVLLFAVGMGYYTARLQNLVWNHTQTANLSFESTLKARALVGLWLKNGLLLIVTLGLYFPFAQVASARLRLQAVVVTTRLPVDELTARVSREEESAAGDAAGDLLGLDLGL